MYSEKNITDYLKLLGDKNRLKIINTLSDSEKCVCIIYEELKLPQNLTSHHLKLLKDSGLLKSRKDGRFIYYSVDKKVISEISKYLNNL